MLKAFILIVAAITFPLGAQETKQAFLEGFPDVPLLEGMHEVASERIVFDAPSGTVAQTELTVSGTAKTALDQYLAALPAFGWQCQRAKNALLCVLDGNKLMFNSKNFSGKNERIILRLEPSSSPDMPQP